MIRLMPRFGIPVGGLELILAGGAAYLAWEHEQGRHGKANLLCPICWVNRIAPESQPPERPAEAPQD